MYKGDLRNVCFDDDILKRSVTNEKYMIIIMTYPLGRALGHRNIND